MKRFLSIISLLALSVSAQIPTAIAAGGSGGSPYFEIATPFVVNITANGGAAFLQVNAQFKVKNEELKQHLSTHLPAIQHTVMLVLSEQTASGISSVKGKQKLRELTLKEIQDFLTTQIGDPVVEEIYFTGFIIQ